MDLMYIETIIDQVKVYSIEEYETLANVDNSCFYTRA